MSYMGMQLAKSLSPTLPTRVTVWPVGNMASLVPVYSLLAVLENFCGTLSISERTVSQSGEGAVGGKALEAKHTFFSAL